MSIRPIIAATASAAVLLFSSSALAATTPLKATEILQQFNLVVLNNDTSNSHVDGRAYIGGALSGGDYVQHAGNTPASSYAGLTVGGSANNIHVNGLGAVIGGSLSNSTVNSGSSVINGAVSNSNLNGPAYIGGSKSGSHFNGGVVSTPSALMQTNAAAATSTAFAATLTSLSTQLSKLSGTGTVDFNGHGKTTFNAVSNSSGVAVFDLNAINSQVFSSSEFSFNLNGATTIIINSNVTSATIGANFLGGQAQSLGAKIIWNFYNATSLTTNSQFGGSILATKATLTNNQNIEGGVFVKNLNQHGEIHLQPFSGTISPVPEPGTYVSMLAGLMLMGFTFTHRRKSLPEA